MRFEGPRYLVLAALPVAWPQIPLKEIQYLAITVPYCIAVLYSHAVLYERTECAHLQLIRITSKVTSTNAGNQGHLDHAVVL